MQPVLRLVAAVTTAALLMAAPTTADVKHHEGEQTLPFGIECDYLDVQDETFFVFTSEGGDFDIYFDDPAETGHEGRDGGRIEGRVPKDAETVEICLWTGNPDQIGYTVPWPGPASYNYTDGYIKPNS